MSGDDELLAMSSCLSTLEKLDKAAQERSVRWLADKLEISLGASHLALASVSEAAPVIRDATITTVAARLSVKSCRDLFVAAAIHLSLFQNKERFSRGEWVACAKQAKQWKVDYSVQMATSILRLLNSGFVNETAKDVFSVPDDRLKEFETRIN